MLLIPLASSTLAAEVQTAEVVAELPEAVGNITFTADNRVIYSHHPEMYRSASMAVNCAYWAVRGSRHALSDGITPSRVPDLLAYCRDEEPEVDTRLFQVPFTQPITGLQDDLYGVCFAQSNEVGECIRRSGA